ncbi:transcription antitermination factor NusB [Staphylospora marina]|uniref:transcription antitermination factor NusB n=1 Tax=Staphylospora marina TaxID=2490858 RepID=UPI000F5C0A57|nr:transcription antitermination factor NusB [Staphylospora marina]
MRRIARERVVQALYASEFHPEDAMGFIAEHGMELEGESRDFYFRLSRGVLEHAERIDGVIRRFLKKGWTLERVSSVDRAILRMAVYELLMEPETPPAVVINEAVELAKAFGGDESGRFINGLLGSVIPKLDELRAEAGTL